MNNLNELHFDINALPHSLDAIPRSDEDGGPAASIQLVLVGDTMCIGPFGEDITFAAARSVWAISELRDMILAQLDLVGLTRLMRTSRQELNDCKRQLAIRYWKLIAQIVPRDKCAELVERVERCRCTFGGWKVLTVIHPGCESSYHPLRNVFTLFTPRSQFEGILGYFRHIGFRRTRVAGITLELDRRFYRADTVYDCVNMRSNITGALIDIVGSVNEVSCYAMLSMPGTHVMHAMNNRAVFAPYAPLTCDNKSISNTTHSVGRFNLMMPVQIEMAFEMLRDLYGMNVSRNPASFVHHHGQCGFHIHCLHTLRSTISRGAWFVEYSGDSALGFFGEDGFQWRLGGYACYQGSANRSPLRSVITGLHTSHHDPTLLDELMSFPPNDIFRGALGWDDSDSDDNDAELAGLS